MRPALVASTTAIGAILFVQSVRTLGLTGLEEAVVRIGWGFAAILLLSGAREAVRALAWSSTVEGPAPLSFRDAFRARLAGEALSTLLPMGIVVGEPTKAERVAHRLPFAAAFSALVVEFTFYCGSLAPLFGLAVAALFPASTAPLLAATALIAILYARNRSRPAAIAVGLDTPAIGGALDAPNARPEGGRLHALRRTLDDWRRRADPVLGFASRHPHRVRRIVLLEGAFQALAVAEVYVTLALISPRRAAWTSAVVLETVSRAVTMVFKMLPMRMGVDETGAAIFANRLGLGTSTGITLALVRKVRLLFWSAVGLSLLAARPQKVLKRVPQVALALLAITAAASFTGLPGLTAVAAAAAQPPTSSVTGTVLLQASDGQPVVVPGVTLTLTCATAEARLEVSNELGQFRFLDVQAGQCSVVAELQGFKTATKTVALRLDLENIHEEVNVTGNLELVDGNAIAAHVERITASVMQSAPIASERFQDALPLIPGVVRGPDGLLNINGSRSNQSGLVFNSANGTDPVTGEDAIELPIDAVSAVQVRGAAFAPEFGLSAGAVTTVETQRAGDAWHVTVNDLEPRVRRRAGEFRGIESWTPRVTVGGPIVAGKVSLLESVQYEYSQTRTFGLPAFQSDTKLQSFESYTRADWTANPANHITASAMVSPRKTTYAGLNTFNPQGVTPDIENHNLLGSATDQILVGGRGVLETRVSVKQFDSTIYPSQGRGPMVLSPDVNSGSYFNDQDRTSRRVEWLSTYAFTPIGPMHLVKIGAGVTRETFDGVNTSRPVDIVRENGTLSQNITFAGSGSLGRGRTALQGYAQDSWTASPRLTIQYGGRYDYDSFTGDVNLAPRASFTAVASGDGRTIVRGGAGVFYNPVTLNVATFEQMQERILTVFAADGVTPVGAPSVMRNAIASEIHTPRSVNWNLEVDREWMKNLFVRVGYAQREGRFESVLDPTSSATGEPVLLLRSDGRSRYREGQITGRYQFHGTDQIVGSYTRSSAVGNLNDFNSYFGNIENPVIRPDARGPLPWDAPNRYLFWSNVSLPRGFTLFPLLDVRTGFPLSVIDEDRNFVGARNEAGRYPTFISLDTQVTKRLRLFGHNTAVGLKVFNITNHFNPRDYQGNLASVNFGGFANSVGRSFRGKWVFEF
jgi:hypothetical protein